MPCRVPDPESELSLIPSLQVTAIHVYLVSSCGRCRSLWWFASNRASIDGSSLATDLPTECGASLGRVIAARAWYVWRTTAPSSGAGGEIGSSVSVYSPMEPGIVPVIRRRLIRSPRATDTTATTWPSQCVFVLPCGARMPKRYPSRFRVPNPIHALCPFVRRQRYAGILCVGRLPAAAV
jgi:hypothetical protein